MKLMENTNNFSNSIINIGDHFPYFTNASSPRNLEKDMTRFNQAANSLYEIILSPKNEYLTENNNISTILKYFTSLPNDTVKTLLCTNEDFNSLYYRIFQLISNMNSILKNNQKHLVDKKNHNLDLFKKFRGEITELYFQFISQYMDDNYQLIDLDNIKQDILIYKNKIGELKDLIETVSQLKKKYLEIVNSLEELETTQREKFENHFSSLEKAFDNKSNFLYQEYEKLEESVDKISKNLNSRLDDLKTDVNKEELAHYFKLEADELKYKYWISLSATLIGMIIIFFTSGHIYREIIVNQVTTITHQMLLMTAPFFMILTWFTWFSSKQFSYIKQIRDEYEYKYALSKSYLSYRKEAEDLSGTDKKELLLLGSVINNIATSPVQSVKSDCHTPFSEILSAAKEVIKQPKE